MPGDLLGPKARRRLQPSEHVVILYCLALILVCAIFRSRIPGWYLYAGGHAAIAALTMWMAGAGSAAGRFFRAFDVALYIPALFLMACQLVHRVHPVDYDVRLIAIDRAIGGVALLEWMGSIETPLLTRLSLAVWLSYYVIAFIPGIALYRRESPRAFEEAKVVFVLGWLLSYGVYFLVPAEGPGYHAEKVGVAQPAWDGGTSVVKQAVFALEGEARDTFPSGHAVIAALTIFLCLKNRAWAAAAIAVPLSIGVIWSTLYLRYHYLADVLAGLALAALCAAAGIAWHRRYSAGTAAGIRP